MHNGRSSLVPCCVLCTSWIEKGVSVSAPTGNRTQGKCLESAYVTTTPLVLLNLTNLQIFVKITIHSSEQIIHHTYNSHFPWDWRELRLCSNSSANHFRYGGHIGKNWSRWGSNDNDRTNNYMYSAETIFLDKVRGLWGSGEFIWGVVMWLLIYVLEILILRWMQMSVSGN